MDRFIAFIIGLIVGASVVFSYNTHTLFDRDGGPESKLGPNDIQPDVEPNDGITDFTMFIAMPGTEIDEDNDIKGIIADLTGVRVYETYLTGQTANEAVGSIVASGNLPDFIDGGDGMMQLYDAGCLIPWDDYLSKYPNLKEMYTEEEWEQFRQEDGHIYWANVFNNTYGKDKTTTHNDRAFWVQARVLEWAGYPIIETLDEYFDLLEAYYKENKTFTNSDGEEVDIIPYTTLCDDWRYFCVESAPQFLAGYPNDGCVIVNTTDYDEPTVEDYNVCDTAYRYFKKLNEEYSKGIVDKDFAKQVYDEYITKLSTGAVLGMCDDWWDFGYTVTPVMQTTGLSDLGCEYVPLGLTIDKGMTQRWHLYNDTLNAYSGIAVTTSCSNPDLAFSFLNDMLDQKIHDLRFWGVNGVDYLIDDDGLYYRTEEMRMNLSDPDYQLSHMCTYEYFPQWLGTSKDGINAMQPQQQPSEYYATLSEPVKDCLMAYGAYGFPDMIGSVVEEPAVWFPMYSYSNSMTTNTPGGLAWTKMGETKHEWIPNLIVAKNFDSTWKKYLKAYAECKPEDYLAEQQEELERRIKMAQK